MAKYRKKPVVIEAVQLSGDYDSDGTCTCPGWIHKAFDDGVLYFDDSGELYVHTLEGEHHASVGDYIIQGVKGELYPCKPDIFEQTYEKVGDGNDD